MSTTGLELQNSLNSWKKVSKVRNTARRPASKMLKLSQQPGNGSSPKQVEAAEVPEHAKRASSRRRSSVSIEHVPIKKRRYILQSPSPPSLSPPRSEVSQELCNGAHDSDRQISSDLVAEKENVELGPSDTEGAIHPGFAKILKCTSGTHGQNEDFSGIAMLADAACSDIVESSAGGNGSSAGAGVLMQEQCGSDPVADRNGATGSPEFSGSSSKAHDESAALLTEMEETKESFPTTSSLPTEARKMDGLVALISKDSSESNDSGKNAEELTGSSSGSLSHDDRRHWDLNVVMDEWNDLDDDPSGPSALNFVESTSVDSLQNQNMENVGCSDVHDGSVEVEISKELTLLPSLGEVTRSVVLSKGIPCTAMSNPVEHVLQTSCPERNFVSSSVRCLTPETSKKLDSEILLQMDTRVSSISSTLHLQSDLKAEIPAANHEKETAANSIELIDEGSVFSMDVLQTEKSSVGALTEPCNLTCQQEEPCPTVVEKYEIAFFHGSESSNTSSEPNAALSTDIVDHEKIIVLNNSENELGKVSYLTAESLPVGDEITAHELESVSLSACRTEDAEDAEDVSISVVAAKSEPSLDDGEVKEIIKSTPVVKPSNHHILEHYTANAFSDRVDIHASNVGRFHTEDLLDGGIDSHMYHEDHGQGGNANAIEGFHTEDLLDGGLDSHMYHEDRGRGGNAHVIEGFHTEDLLDGGLDSHMYHEDRGRGGNATAIEGGYDSHLEDGELREPVELFWGGNEGEEAEHVDYDSDNRDGYETTDATNGPVLSLGRTSCRVDDEQEKSPSKQCNVKDDPLTSDMCTIQNGCRSSGSLSTADTAEQFKHDVVDLRLKTGRKAGVGSDGFTAGAIDASEKVGDAWTEVDGVATPKRELISRIEGPGSSDKKDADPIRRSRSNNFTSMHDGDEKHTGSDESMSKGRSFVRLEGRDQLGNRSWNRNLKSTFANYANADGDRIMRSSDDSSPGIRRPATIPTSTGGYSHLSRKGLSSGNDEAYGRGKVMLQDVSPDNAMRRFDRYSGINNRGYRVTYRRPGVYENPDSAGGIRNQFARRERSFSPICNRADHLHQGHRRSRSRSRSHSPDFRSEARPGRMRIAYQQNNHAAAHVRQRKSPPSRMFIQGQRFDPRGSPERCIRPIMRPVRFSATTSSGRRYEYEGGDEFKPHPPRSHRRSRSRSRTRSPEFRSEAIMGTVRVPYQSRTSNHMRDRRSPVRVFRPAQRFDDAASPGRMRAEGHVRPIMRPARFSDATHSDRGNDYEDDEFRRKPRKMYIRSHQIRNFEMDDDARRFQYDTEDDNVQQNFHSTERRSGDVLRSSREERGSTRYNSDRVY